MPRGATYNANVINRLLADSTAAKLLVLEALQPVVQDKQEELVRNFEAHPVTQEIEDGPYASNISGTLSGEGNLFSFIGFYEGSDPIEVIREILYEPADITVLRRVRNNSFLVNISGVDKEDIFAETPLPWATQISWAESIERGLSGFGQYLYKEEGLRRSRSTTGLQIKGRIRSGSFKNTKYISELINNFRKSLRGIRIAV